jgi:hypothetical protein
MERVLTHEIIIPHSIGGRIAITFTFEPTREQIIEALQVDGPVAPALRDLVAGRHYRVIKDNWIWVE